jgi:hypothetical protein
MCNQAKKVNESNLWMMATSIHICLGGGGGGGGASIRARLLFVAVVATAVTLIV